MSSPSCERLGDRVTAAAREGRHPRAAPQSRGDPRPTRCRRARASSPSSAALDAAQSARGSRSSSSTRTPATSGRASRPATSSSRPGPRLMAAYAPVGSGPVGVGFIGAGDISDTYLENLKSFPDVEVLIARRHPHGSGRVAGREARHAGTPAAPPTCSAHPGVELVINLTIPAVHVEVSVRRSSPPASTSGARSRSASTARARCALLEQADAAGLRVGVAPDTVLGPGIQSAKRAIERGDIGRPLFAQTSMQYQGPEVFHPNPAFLYAHGAGPLFDMGPYYLTSLVSILGPVAAVAAARAASPSSSARSWSAPTPGRPSRSRSPRRSTCSRPSSRARSRSRC